MKKSYTVEITEEALADNYSLFYIKKKPAISF